MILYGDKRDSELKLKIGTGAAFSYQELSQFQRDGLLEDFDSFNISSELHYKLCIYYCQGKYYLITNGRNIKPIDGNLLQGRQITVVSKSTTNNIQHYLQIHGSKALEELSKDEVIDIITGSTYRPSEQLKLEDLAQELEIDER